MSDQQFDLSLQLLKQVSKKINEIGDYPKIEKVSFVYYDCKNAESLETLKNSEMTGNILAITDLEIRKDNLITIDKEKWEKNKKQFYELTRNAIFINESSELASEESYSFLNSISDYYPIVLLFSSENLKKKEIEKSGFSSYKTKKNELISCNINKKLKKFPNYSFESFKKIDDFIVTISGLRSIKRGKNIFHARSGKEKDLFLEEEKKSESSSKEEPDLEFLKGLPVPTVKKNLNRYNQPTSKKWMTEFYEYLKDLFERFFPEKRKNLIPQLLTSETIRNYWIPCFTHESANPNRGENYETFETVGDVSLGFCFITYMSNKIPTANQEDLSNLKQKYLSKPFQAKLGREMKLNDWMIIFGIPKDKLGIGEDLMEALFGTIEKILFMKSKDLGLGSSICYNFIKLVFENVDINLVGQDQEDRSKKGKNIEPVETFVQQMFQGQAFKYIQLNKFKFKYTNIPKPDSIPDQLWKNIVKDMNKKLEKSDLPLVVTREDGEKRPGIIEDVKTRPDGKIQTTIYLMKDYASEARKRGIDIPDEKIKLGEAVSNIQKVAVKNAYTKAKEYMISKGITKEWREKLKSEEKSIPQEKIEKVFEKAKEKYPDLVSVKVKRMKGFKEVKDLQPYQIIGEETSGKLVSIFTETVADKNYEEGIVDDYLES